MQHLKHAIRLLTALTVSIAALALSSCSDDFWTLKYKITYSTEHGSTPAAIEVESGTLLTSAHLPTLTADGYTFDGWKDTTLQIKITEGYTIKSDLNLVAQWTEDSDSTTKCEITYFSMYGDEPDSITVNKNSTLKSSQLPTLTDSTGEYDFVGWYNKKDSTKTIITAGSNFKVTKDIILVAKWSIKGGQTTGEAVNVTWLSANAGEDKVTLTWTYPSDDFSKITICVSRTQGSYEASELIDAKIVNYTTGKTEGSYTFEGLASGTTYWFKVVSKNAAGEAAKNPIEISATTKGTSTNSGNSGSTGSGSTGSGDSGNTGSSDSGDTGGLIILVQ